jgi:hypothetical protein
MVQMHLKMIHVSPQCYEVYCTRINEDVFLYFNAILFSLTFETCEHKNETALRNMEIIKLHVLCTD